MTWLYHPTPPSVALICKNQNPGTSKINERGVTRLHHPAPHPVDYVCINQNPGKLFLKSRTSHHPKAAPQTAALVSMAKAKTATRMTQTIDTARDGSLTMKHKEKRQNRNTDWNSY